jgi:response regulator RpfG family c-di-GMP phosphodiesterase
MSASPSFLIANTDKTIVLSLKKVVSKLFPEADIFIAENGIEAWNIVQQNEPLIVIADISMPHIDGLKLCNKIRNNKNYDKIYYIILSGDIDIIKRAEVIQAGADDFLTRPINSDEFETRIKLASRLSLIREELAESNKLVLELGEELEKDIQDMTKLAIKFLQARIPTSFEMLKRVAAASVWIAKQLNEFEKEEIRDIEIAAYLCQAGKVFLPDNLLKTPVHINGQPSHNLMYQVPVTGRDIISAVRRFKDSGMILYHLYENFDGSGFPDRIQSWQIPMGSRIIRVALDYEVLRDTSNKKPREILQLIQNESKRLYDHRIVVLMEHYIKSIVKEEYDESETAVQLHELKDGMLLTRDIITNSGLKLLPAGATLRDKIIEKILSINTSDPILGNIYVKK